MPPVLVPKAFLLRCGGWGNGWWQCRTFIEDLLASHSTDLQQRAYELQAILALSPETVANILPMDASCEDIEVPNIYHTLFAP
jgi:hypothetical protein